VAAHRPFRFGPPALGSTAVLRPRLIEPLSRRFDVRLVTVEAGAGLGKTTLLAQAADENRLSPRGRDAWLTCEPADSSPSVLLGALLRAVTRRESDSPPSVHELCAAIWSAAPEHVCVVLDDAQHIEHGSGGELALRQLLTDLPENGHLVVAGRRIPDLALARMLLHRQVLQLTDRELVLDGDEVDELAARHGVEPTVVRAAGGWPALAELHARLGSVDARRFVWEEVVEPLEARERDAFLFLVAVGGADVDALTAAMGSPVDGERIADLPLVAVDDRGGLRPHPVWEELLVGRIDAELTASSRRALAEAFAARGQHGDAFELLAGTGSWDRALGVLLDACDDLDHPAWPDEMERWARLLPESLKDRPEVAYLRGVIALAGDAWSGVARAAFAEAVDEFRARDDTYHEILSHVRLSQLGWIRGDRAAVAAVQERGEELVAQGWPLDALLHLGLATMADIDGRPDEVIEAASRVEGLDPRYRHFPLLLRVFAHLAAGDPEPAAEDARGLAAAMPSKAPTAEGFEASCLPAVAAWAMGDLDAALAHSLHDPGPRHSLAQRAPTLATGAVFAAHLGDVATARTAVSAIDGLVVDIGDRDLLAGYRAVAGAALAVALGDEDAAIAALAEHLDGRSLAPATGGRAIAWFPSLPYLFHEPARSLLDELGSGASRRRTLDACRALLAARAGTSWSPPALLEDPDALLTALPAPLATELTVHAAAVHGTGPTTLAALARRAPEAVRRTLHALCAEDASATATAAAARSLLRTVAIPPPHSIRIEVLGPTRLLLDGEPVKDPTWRRRRVRDMVCALVAHREIKRTLLGALLWPEFDEEAVSANLRMTLSYVQSLLEPQRGRGDSPWFLQQHAGVLRLRGDEHLTVDAWEVEAHLDAAAAAAAAGAPSIELDRLLRVLELWRGDYLDDVAYEEWAQPLVARLRGRFLGAAVRASELLVAAGRLPEAIHAAEAALDADRWCEPARRALDRAHAAAMAPSS
jgi:DNA-binding SARP family transcriptional activator